MISSNETCFHARVGCSKRRTCSAVTLLVLALLMANASRTAAETFDVSEGPLSIPAEEIRAWAAREAERAGATDEQVLLSQTDVTIHPDGSRQIRRWSIRQLHSQQAVRDSIRFEASWSPWQSDRPTIAARIIQPSGQSIELTSEQAIVQDDRGESGDTVDDTKRLILLLAGLRPQSIVEKVETYQHHAKLTGAFVDSAWLAGLGPTALHRVSITAQPGAAFHFRVAGWDHEPVVQERAEDGEGWKKVVFEQTSVKSIIDYWQINSGSDLAPAPLVQFGRLGEWQAIGRAYDALLQPIIAQSSDTAALLTAGIDPDAGTDKQLNACLDRLRQSVVYTGVEFGVNRIVPYTAEEIVTRGFGDCKDQSSLLLAMLDHLGIKSRPALLQTGPGMDVPADMPALNSFDHMILRVELDDEYVWIDPTAAGFPPGLLPAQCAGRRALVIDGAASELTQTPTMAPEDDHYSVTSLLQVDSSGYGERKETTLYEHIPAINLHNLAEGNPQSPEFRSWIAEQFEADLQHTTVKSSPDEPLKLGVEVAYPATQLGDYQDQRITLSYDMSDLLLDIPQVFQPQQTGTDEGERMERVHPAFALEAMSARRVVDIRYPAFLQVRQIPAPSETVAGPVTVRVASESEELPDKQWSKLVVTAELVVDPAAGPVDAQRLDEIRNQLSTLLESSSPLQGVVTVVDPAAFDQAAESDVGKMIEAAAQRSLAFPADVQSRVELAEVLQQAGMLDAARSVVREALALSPQHLLLLRRAEQLFIRGHDGEVFGSGFDPVTLRPLARRYAENYPDDIHVIDFSRAFLVDANQYREDDSALNAELRQMLLPFLEASLVEPTIHQIAAEKVLTSLLCEKGNEELASLCREIQQMHHSLNAPFQWIALQSESDGTERWFREWTSGADGEAIAKPLVAESLKFLLGFGRDDLAREFTEQLQAIGHDELIPFEDAFLETVEVPERSDVDRGDPLAVARLGLGMLLTDEPPDFYLSQELPNDGWEKALTPDPALMPLILAPKSNWTPTAIREFVQRVPAALTEPTIGGTLVEFTNPFGAAMGVTAAPLPIYAVPWEDEGQLRWFIGGDRQALVRWTQQLIDRGQWEATREAVELLYSWSGELPWFDQLSGSAAARAWLRLKDGSDEELKLALAVFAIEADPDGPNHADRAHRVEEAAGQTQHENVRTQLQRSLLSYHIHHGNLAERHRILHQLFQRHPQSSMLISMLALTAAKTGKEDEVQVLFKQNETLQGNGYSEYLMAFAHAHRGAWEEAFAAHQSLQDHPDLRADVANVLTWQTLLQQADRETQRRSADLLQASMEATPTPHGLHTLACALMQLGEPADGLTHLQNSMRQRESVPGAFDGDDVYAKGVFCQAIGLRDEAVAYYRRVLAEDPSCGSAPLARRGLEELAAAVD